MHVRFRYRCSSLSLRSGTGSRRYIRRPGAPSYKFFAASGGAGARAELRADVEDALQHRHRAERHEHVHGRCEEAEVGEQDADRQDHDAHGAARDPHLALDAERLGARAGVADHQRREHGGDRRGRGDLVAVRGEHRGDRGEDDALLDAVERRVEERAELRALARHARVAPVHRVAHRADDEGDAADDEELLPDQHGGDDVQDQAGDRDRVRREPRLDQAVAHDLAARARADRRARALRARGPRAGLRVGHQAVAFAGWKAQAAGRARASHAAVQAPTPAVAAPRTASVTKWLAVETITKTTTNGYSAQSVRVTRCLHSRESGTASIRANATCIEGIAAYWLTSELTATLSWLTCVRLATESAKPHSGKKRGGAAGNAMKPMFAVHIATANMLRTK